MKTDKFYAFLSILQLNFLQLKTQTFYGGVSEVQDNITAECGMYRSHLITNLQPLFGSCQCHKGEDRPVSLGKDQA